MINIGVIKTSFKENERRIPIHPAHLTWIPKEVYRYLVFEKGYGESFDFDDKYIEKYSGGLAGRQEIFQKCEVVLITKPIKKDFEDMKENGVMCGWIHCVQQKAHTQAAIDRKLTLITWENMFDWSSKGVRGIHIFHKNNEMAGYAGVVHALSLMGRTACYGPPRKVIVFSFGSVSRGAIHALLGLGFRNINVFTLRPPRLVEHQTPGVIYRQFKRSPEGMMIINVDGSVMPLIDEISKTDVIVNGTLQDTDNPLMYLKENEIDKLKPKSVIIDVSCDRGMGFTFARPTTFDDPIFKVGNDIHYYSVDHTPSYLWDSATWEISKSILPFLPVLIKGHGEWNKDETLRRAIDINTGIIHNKKILSFQKRSPEYPYKNI